MEKQKIVATQSRCISHNLAKHIIVIAYWLLVVLGTVQKQFYKISTFNYHNIPERQAIFLCFTDEKTDLGK